MKNRKRLLTSIAPPRPPDYSALERILVVAAGAGDLPWTSITFTLQAGKRPRIQIEALPTHEDLAAAVEIGRKMGVEK